MIPPTTLLIENPAAVTVDAKDGAQDFLDFVVSPEAQALYAGFGFRPVGVELTGLDELLQHADGGAARVVLRAAPRRPTGDPRRRALRDGRNERNSFNCDELNLSGSISR